jgi:Cysteine-rich CPCC
MAGHGSSAVRRGVILLIAVGQHLLIDRCPCCGYRTGCTTCPVCFWTDDGRPEQEVDAARGGSPNGELTLRDARLNFAIYGACHPRYEELVRAPRADEHP